MGRYYGKRKAFTLVEVIVILGIALILTGIIIQGVRYAGNNNGFLPLKKKLQYQIFCETEYRDHQYIVYNGFMMINDVNYPISGIVHNPDCPCLSEKVEKE